MKIGDVFLVVGISIVVGVLSAYVMIASGVVVPEAVSSTQSAAGSFEGDSQEVNAQGITVNVDWDDIENVPTDLADGDADTRCDASGVCSQVCIGSDCKTAWPSGDGTSSVSGSGIANSCDGDEVCEINALKLGTVTTDGDYSPVDGYGIFATTFPWSEHLGAARLFLLGNGGGYSAETFISLAVGLGEVGFVVGNSGGSVAISSNSEDSAPSMIVNGGSIDVRNEDSNRIVLQDGEICFVDDNYQRDCISSWDELR